MTFQIDRQYANQEIVIPIETRGEERIVCRVFNPKKAMTVYFDAAPIIKGKDVFIIKIPRMPEVVYLDLYNVKNGNVPAAKNGQPLDTSFRVGKISIKPIKQTFAIGKILNPNVASFAKFLDDFAENASILSAQNSIYKSADNKFRIDYLDVIRDEKGRELKTPYRINSNGLIQASKKYVINQSVPGRKMWLWHEFAHVYINKNPENELEADKHAIMIYLGTGNPIIEAYNVIYSCFKNSPSDLNKSRYVELNKYIKNFYGNMQSQVA